jgi:hypothetical protein
MAFVVAEHGRARFESPKELPFGRARLRVAFTLIWFTCLVLGSLLPLSFKAALHTHGRLHLPLHFAAFAVSGMIVFSSTRSAGTRILLFLALITVGFSLEMLQVAIYQIIFEWRDFVADICGVFVGLVFCAMPIAARNR